MAHTILIDFASTSFARSMGDAFLCTKRYCLLRKNATSLYLENYIHELLNVEQRVENPRLIMYTKVAQKVGCFG